MENSREPALSWRKGVPYFFSGAVLLLLAAVLVVGLQTGIRYTDVLSTDKMLSLTQARAADGTAVAMPVHANWKNGIRYSYSFQIPEEGMGIRDPVLFFATHYMDVRFYLDGEPLGECLARPEGKQNSQGKVFAVIPLPEDYAGSELRMDVELLLGAGVNYEVAAPVIGDWSNILADILKRDMPGILIDLVIFCFSLVLILFGLQRGPMRREGTFLYTGLFAMGFSLYSLAASDAPHLFVSNSYLIYLFEFLLLAFFPIPLAAGIYKRCSSRYRRILQVDLAVLAANFFLQAALHFFTSLELRNTVVLTHGTMLISVALLIPVLIWGWVSGERRWALAYFAPMIIGVLCDILLFYFSTFYRSSLGIRLGVLLFIILQAYSLIRTYLEYCKNDLKASMYRRMAYTDVLTQLANRAAFEEKIVEINQNIRCHTSLWCVCADVNNLKNTNDVLGHAAGDELIRGAAQTLQSVMCDSCSLYRTGGDEFVMFVFDQPKDALLEGRHRFDLAVERYNQTHEVGLSVAIGFDQYRLDGEDSVADLISRADACMYQDKKAWKEKTRSSQVETIV